jgi:ABC-2 type transport system ATP-binding protein
MTSLSIAATDLVVMKSKKIILDKLTFEIVPGKITGLIGPSGSGKTTLMRTIVGVQKYKGDLKVLEKNAGHRSLRRKIGYVTQSPAVYTDLTVEQNLRYFGSLVGAKPRLVDRVIGHVRLEKQKKQIVESLSGGQKARVSLAVALLGDPDLLVLDEPTVGLDPVLRNELWELFADIADSGKTLLVSSHVMDEAERCDNLMLLRDGKLLWNDSRDDLLKHTGKKDVGNAFIAMIEKGGKA